ncbi:MAG TPA: nuclear transport factor 2 family protein [Longimicrobium sp.]|jgi:ketosteroid isomerase-like protein
MSVMDTVSPVHPARTDVGPLRPCPFCGGAAALEPDPWLDESVRVACGNGACPVKPKTEYLLACYAGELRAAWNGRAEQSTVPGRRPQMPESRIADLVRRYFASYQAVDREAMEDLLADDFTFTSPWDDHISRERYFAHCWPHAGSFRFREPMKIFAEGGEAFVRYETEGKPGGTFRNTEFFTFDGDRIRSIEVFFGFVPNAEAVRDAAADG